MFGSIGKRIAGLFGASSIREIFREFTVAAAADIATGRGNATVTAQTVAKAAGEQLKGRFLGLGFDDEAAILQALSLLEPHEVDHVVTLLRSLGDPDKEDTPEACTFRSTIVKLSSAEARAEVLRMCAGMSVEEFKEAAGVTGAGGTSQILRRVNQLKALAPQVVKRVKDADANAADNMRQLGDRARGMFARWKEELERDDESPATPPSAASGPIDPLDDDFDSWD